MSSGKMLTPQRRALAVVLLELVGLDPVGRRALLAPGRVPDARALQDRVGVDRVDADAARAALLGEAAREVQLGRLGGGVGGGVLAGDERVLGGDEDDRAAAALPLEHPERLARDEEVARHEDLVVAAPLGERRVLQRRARRDAGVRDDDVDAAVSARPRSRRPRATSSSLVTSPLTARPRRRRRPRRRPRAPAWSRSKATTHAPAAASASPIARPMPPGAARDQRDLALQLAGRRRLRELVELERPVLDREALLRVERDELAERLGARHHLDRAVVEVARELRGLGRRAGGDEPEVLDQHDPRIGVGGLGRLVAVFLHVRAVVRAERARRARRSGRAARRRRRSPGRTGSTAAARLVWTRWSGHGAPTVTSCSASAEETNSTERGEVSTVSTLRRSLETAPRIAGSSSCSSVGARAVATQPACARRRSAAWRRCAR